MTVTILNNSAAIMTLGELNKNINRVGKSLSKVAAGQKLNGADDDASAFGISEKMRAKIRELEQDIQNVQNGSSLLKTALGGIQNIVDELRALKELAIDAANDHNTDEDRAVMQKVLKQKQANIDDIAFGTTFNTKRILDGTYAEPHWKEIYRVQYMNNSEDLASIIEFGEDDDPELMIEKAMTLRKTAQGNIDLLDADHLNKTDLANRNVNINVLQKPNTVTGLADAFEAMHNGVTFADGTRAVETRDTALYAQRPENIKPDSVVPNRNFIRSGGGAPLAVRLDFSGARDADGYLIFGSANLDESIMQLDGQDFSILCSNSSHFVNIVFTADGDEAEWNTLNNVTQDLIGGFDQNTAATGDVEYTVGLSGFAGNEEYEQNQAGFARYVFDRIRDCEGRKDHLQSEYKLRAGLTFVEDNKNNFALSQQFNLRMAQDGEGNVYLTKLEPYSCTPGILDEGVLRQKYIKKKGVYSAIGEIYEYREYLSEPLWIQHAR